MNTEMNGNTYLALFYNKSLSLEEPKGVYGADFELWLYL